MDFETMVLNGLVKATEDRQQPVTDWLNAWVREGDSMPSVILAGLYLLPNGNDRVEVQVNGEMTVLLNWFQVEALKRLLLASLS